MYTWAARLLRTAVSFANTDRENPSGYRVRIVLQLTSAHKRAVGRQVDCFLSVAEARAMAAELLERADIADRTNKDAGYRI